MQQIKISVFVSVESALKHGRTHHGLGSVALDESDIAKLTPEGKAEITSATKEGGLLVLQADSYGNVYSKNSLEVDEPTPAAVVAALNGQSQKRIELARQVAAKREQEILAALSAPVDDWIYPCLSDRLVYYPHVYDSPSGVYLKDEQQQDPRVIAHRAALERDVLPGLVAEYEKVTAEREAEEKAKADRERAESERVADLFRSYVMQFIPEYYRAAQEGCDVKRVALDHLRDSIVSDFEKAGLVVLDSYQTREQPVPRAIAYERKDKVEAVLATLEKHPLVKSYSATISRADISPDKEEYEWHTCVIVDVRCLDGNGLEDIAVDAEDGSEEEEQGEVED